ncbi:MAG: CotH kinase family protein, partial [Chitinophagales bacterium]
MKKFTLLAAIVFLFTALPAQIVLNEASNRNATQILDEDGDYEDWFELYNSGSSTVNLSGYSISDDSLELAKWTFPPILLNPSNHLFVYASGKDRLPDFTTDHYEFPVSEDVVWNYIVPDATTPTDWMNLGFDDSGWNTGEASVGYGDADDSSIVSPGTMSVYMRYAFNVDDTSEINNAIFHIDFDDGFVAYLNGNIIASYGFSGTPAYDAPSGLDHESGMYAGYAPMQFPIDEATLHAYLTVGTNVLAVQVHNVSSGSSDLTANPFLSFALATSEILWSIDFPFWYSSYYSGTNLHTNFKIGTEGETLFLSDASGVIIDQILVDDLEADFSIGRKTDGNDTLQIFTSATPGYSNNASTSYTGYVASPAFTLNAGFYDAAISTAITIPAGDVSVYYTTDGQIPTTSDNLYTGTPIDISYTTVLKARCFDNTGVLLPGKVITNTYLVDEDITVPVISITTDDVNLYGASGIYDNWWTDWKKPCYIEYFDSLHINAFEQNAGIKIDGGAGGSRSLSQKSFRIEPDNSSYGDGILNYPIIPRLWYVDDYERFYLRNGSNFSNVLPYKDAYMTRITDGTLNEHMAYTPIVVFLNGEYWGLYELRDKLDEPHFEHVHNVPNEELDLLSLSYWYGGVLRTLSGSDSDFYDMKDYLYYYPTPTDTDFFSIANQYLDLYQFTDYLIAETYLGNADWPWNNIKIFRDRGGNNKWQYGLIDVEWGLGYSAWTNAYTDMISYLFGYNYNMEQFYALNQNEKFRHYFVNRYADLMNTTFQADRMLAMEDTIYNEVEGELARQWKRWWTTDMPYAYSVFNDYRFGLLDDLT